MDALHRDYDAMTSELFAQFADPCTVQRGATGLPVAARCVVEDGVARIGEYGQAIGRVRKLDFIKAEWSPARGDVVTFGDGSAQTVESIEADDGLVVECIVNA